MPLRDANKCKQKYELPKEEIEEIMESVYGRKYNFLITPPISDVENLEKGYLNIDFNGRFFLPTWILVILRRCKVD